jgi:hypothetical protein
MIVLFHLNTMITEKNPCLSSSYLHHQTLLVFFRKFLGIDVFIYMHMFFSRRVTLHEDLNNHLYQILDHNSNKDYKK